MDTIKIKWSDFYPTMIFRGFSLLIWRIFILLLLMSMISNNLEIETILRIWLFMTWIVILLVWWSVALHMKYENKNA